MTPSDNVDMSKEGITVELVRRLIAEQFPRWAELPVRPVPLDGWDNTTFRLGSELSVRLPSADHYVAQVEKEHRWLPVLAPRLPLPIPEPVARGRPAPAFPRPWSVYRWIAGEPATQERIADAERLAADLAGFLRALYAIDAAEGPAPGEHNFERGGDLSTYDAETREAIAALAGELDAGAATAVWEAALATSWEGRPVWMHGDVAASNLLVVEGRLAAVIDFGCSAVGDPACDLVMAWTFFSGRSRATFRERLAMDEGTWVRARGWALWKALITLRDARAGAPDTAPRFGWRRDSKGVIDEVLAND